MQSDATYRAHFLRADAIQGIIAMAILGVAQLAFLVNDHKLFGTGPELTALAAVRVGVVAATAAICVVQARVTTPRVHDRMVALWCGLFAAMIAYSNWTRPADYIGQAAPTGAVVLAFYAVIPGPIRPRATAAIVVSFTTFVFTFSSAGPVIGRNALLLTHLAVHALGAVVGIRTSRLRRSSFRAHQTLAERAQIIERERERAESLANAKADFLASMSHELRTPMTAIIGMSELLAKAPLPAEHRAQAVTIQESARGLLVVLDDILDTAKANAVRLVLQRAPFDLPALVRSVGDLFAPAAAAQGLTLVCTIADGVPRGMLGDVARLRQVLCNLLANAVKFTREGGARLEVALAGDVVTFTVADTGPGIEPELRGRLFSPFEQGQAARPGLRGSGLGLAISRRLAEALGGTLALAPSDGVGARFVLTLPHTPIALDEDRAPAPQAVTPLRILVADDNAVNRRVAQAMLASLGHSVTLVEDGQAAISAVQETVYDLVLLDLRMPVMDGFTAASQIRALFRDKPVRPRLFALTASAFPEDHAACFAAGLERVLVKPLTLEALRRDLAEPPAVDLAALDKLRSLGAIGGSSDLVGELCRRFTSETPGQLAMLAAAVERGDAASVESEAHAMRSAAGLLGAARFVDILARLEESARAGELTGGAAHVAALHTELAAVELALAREPA